MMKRRCCLTIIFLILSVTCLTGCGNNSLSPAPAADGSSDSILFTPTSHMELSYAENFSVDYYDGGFSMITIANDSFLLVPEGQEIPADIDIPCLVQPISSLYVASSSAMDLFLHCDAMQEVAMTSTAAADWTIPEIHDAVSDGSITYVGKYHSPDYETVLSKNCGLAIENTMIYHSPETKEMLESLGIPVIVEWSSYEPHPLGRVEWIKLYGLLTGHLDEAEAFFDESLKTLETVLNDEDDSAADTAVAVADLSAIAQPSVANAPSVAIDSSTTSASNVAATSVDNMTSDAGLSVNAADQKTVSFFYITSAGYANVRRPGDYISKMIALAGGDYLFPGSISDDESQLTAINMDLETFYTTSKDADILIYNSTVEADLTSIDDLIKKSPLLEDFKAVKTGDVWCTNKNMFQQISGTAEMIAEMHSIIHADGDIERELIYLHKLK